MREVLVLRHGQTQANVRRAYSMATEPLSAEGRAQLVTRRALYPAADAYFTSGILRTGQTLEAIYGDVPYTEIPDLSEFFIGDFENRTHMDLVENEPLYRQWLDDKKMEAVCPGGESRGGFAERVTRGWQTLVASPWQGLAVLVTHGGVIAALLDVLGQANLFSGPIPNGVGLRVTLDENNNVVGCEAFA